MFNSLYSKLSVALLVLFLLTGLAFLAIARFSTDLYYQEVTQRLNHEIAAHVAAESQLIDGGTVNRPELKQLAHQVMVINPSAEVYLLDREGNILGYEAPPEKIKRGRVALSPIQRYLGAADKFPIVGDDPRDPQGEKIFSVSEVRDSDVLQGYLYIILGGEQYQSIAAGLHRSYIFKLSLAAISASVVFFFLAGLVVFAALTRRLRQLTRAVERFKESDFTAAPEYRSSNGSGDEIDRMGHAFVEVAGHITELLRKLKRTDKLRRELVANVSHDLRTPLSSMQGYIETLLIKEESLSDEERRRYLGIARKHGEQLSRLVGDLFELAKLDSDNVQPNCEIFSLAELAQDVVQKFRLNAEAQGVNLTLAADRSVGFVFADIGLIERVFENLIENAMRHTPQGGSIELRLKEAAGGISVQVSDTGCGIDEADVPHVFERFYRADSTAGGDSPGVGLGLSIVKRIVELHNSRVSVESRLDAGTTFSFTLPAANAP